jgi:tetratricopeptide (TPR) repeat protein
VDDLEAEGLRAEVRRRLFGVTEHAPVRVARYVLHEPLGRGGMGVVHAAYDPDLDRRVALKLVRPGAQGGLDDEARARRLVREAQSIARLSHPNVVTVYEVGRAGSSVFIAMELIEGITLGRWCRSCSPSTWQVLAVLVDAGRGLAAAHARGLVHRDFKPDNVMVDLDEQRRPTRVRVLDFGLARLRASASSEGGEPTSSEATFEEGAMTETGTVLGTPAYMAPEQRGGGAGPASDQFSFCVVLHEALLGCRPPPAPTGAGVELDQLSRGAAQRLPRRLRRALVRGLHPEPRERWPTMDRLLAELEAVARRPRRRAWVLGAGLLATALATGMAMATIGAEPPCEDGPTRRAALWPSMSYAPQTWATVERTLDAYLEDWSAAVDRHCGDPERASPQWSWRAACLEQQAGELDALLALLESGEAGVIEHAAAAASALPRAVQCEGAASRVTPPADSAQAGRVQRLRVELAGLSATAAAGRYAPALPRAAALLEQARALGYGPLVAEATLMLARMHAGAGEGAEAERLLYTVIEQAEAERHDAVAAEAWLTLLEVVGVNLARIDDADRLLAPATGAIRRLGDDDRLLARAWLVEGALRHAQGRFDEAVALYERALHHLEADLGPDHPGLAKALHGIALAEQGRGDPQASLAPARRAVALVQDHHGPDHPDVATYLSSVGNAQGMLGDSEAALHSFERAAPVLEQALGPHHPRLAAALHNLGTTQATLRRFDQALPVLRRAAAIDAQTHGTDHPHAAASRYAIAMVLQQQGDYEQAEAELRAALEGLERAWGPEHPDLAYLLVAQGHLLLERDQAAQSLPLLERGDRLLRRSLGEQHPRRVHGLHGEARALLALGRPEPARERLEQAVVIGEAAALPSLDLAEPRFHLARALPPAEHPRARALAEQAAAAYRAAGPTYDAKREEVERWLDAAGR